MDKYEYNVKSDQIKKLYAKKDYETAAAIADSIDWSRVKNNSMLALVADAYEGTKQYDKARNVLEIAYERSPLGRQLAYRLTILSIRMRDFVAADQYYQEFAEMAPRDVAQYILKYRIARAKGEAIETLISILEAYVDVEMDERWQYELAKLYHEAGEDEKCVDMCDKIILWFSEGKYVTKALELKMRHQPLTEEQQAKYDGKWDYYNERIKAEESAAREESAEESAEGSEETASEQAEEAQNEESSEDEVSEDEISGEDSDSLSGAEEDADAESEKSQDDTPPVKDILNDTTALDYLTDYSEDEKVIKEPDTSDIDELTAMEVEMNLSKVVEESIESAKKDVEDISEIFAEETDEKSEDEADYGESDEEPDAETDREPDEEPDGEQDEEPVEETDREPDEEPDEEPDAEPDAESDEELELGDILSGENEIIDENLVEDEEPEESEEDDGEESDLRGNDENLDDVFTETGKSDEQPTEEKIGDADIESDTENNKNEASDEKSDDDKIEIYEFNEKKDGNAKGIGDELMKTAEIDIDEINVKVNSPENLYDTANIQKALAQSMQIIMKAESEKATRNAFAQSEIMDEPTKRIDISGGESGEKAEIRMENEEKYSGVEDAAKNIESEQEEKADKEEKKTGPVYETVPLPPIYDREEDGQIKIFEPDSEEDEQVEGQMSIEDVLLEFEKSKEEALKEAERKEKLAIEAAKKASEEVALAKEAVRKALEEEAAAKAALAKASEVQKVIGDYTASKENPDGAEMLTQDLEAALAQIQETVTMEAMEEAAASEKENEAEFHDDAQVESEAEGEVETATAIASESESESEVASDAGTEAGTEDETEKEQEADVAESEEDGADGEQKASLSDEDKKLFVEFLDIPGLEEQISATLDNLVNNFTEDGTSRTNNVIIMGDAKIGKTTLGLGIIKAANRGRQRPGRKVAKVKATALNKKGVGPAMSQILGTDLIIEQAGNLMPGTVVDLMAAMKSYTEEMIIVLEDDKAALERLVTAHPTLEDMFTNQIYIREFGIDDYVKIAREYAEQKQYVIDEMGTLALYARIDDINGKNQGISRPEIYEIVDKAISHAEKFKISKLIGKLKRTHYEMGVLKEEDFE